MIYVYPKPGSSLYGILKVYYNKINLTTYIDESIYSTEYFYETVDLLDEVYDQLNIFLRSGDVINDVIDPEASELIDLRISTKCLMYEGTISILTALTYGWLADRVPNVLLNGFSVNNIFKISE